MPDALESMFAEPEINPHTGEVVWSDEDLDPAALDLWADANRLRPETDAAIVASLYTYLESQLYHTAMDPFSLVRKILSVNKDQATGSPLPSLHLA